MPKLWNETIQEHRRAVHDATLDTTAALVAEHGLASVTMSRIAAETGIGRATLYKYFPDVEAILAAWHERHVTRHLAAPRPRPGPGRRPAAAARSRAPPPTRQITQPAHGTELAALVHRGEHVARARAAPAEFHRRPHRRGRAGRASLRDDAAPGELASYCLHALTAAGPLPRPAAVGRLVTVTLAGLRPPR